MRRTNAVFRVPVAAAAFAASIEGLVRLNLLILRGRIPGRHKFPPLLKSNVVYKRERRDVWRDIQQVFESGWGDCEDLAAIVVAQRRFTGEDPDARVIVYQSAPRRFHAIVEHGDGTTEDPSRALGMLPKGRSPYGALEGDHMQHDQDLDTDDDVEGEWDLDDLGGEWDLDELGFDEDDFVGKGPRHSLFSAWKRRKARRPGPKHATLYAYKKKRARAKKLLAFCLKYHKRNPLGHGAWVSVGDDPLEGDPNVTFDLYRSGRGWSGIVRVPTSLLKAGRRQAIIAKTTRTPIKRRKRRRRRRKTTKRRRTFRGRRRRKTTRRRKRGRAKRRTMGKAVNLAARIANLPGVSALIPPQAAMALKVLKHPIAKLAVKGAGKLLKKLKFW